MKELSVFIDESGSFGEYDSPLITSLLWFFTTRVSAIR